MRLQLKPNFRYDRYTVQTGGKTIVTYDRDTERVTIRYCGMTRTVSVIDGVSWVKTAFIAFEEEGWDSPWVNVATAAELTAAAEGEGPVAPVAPAPRLCAVDRLEAAGYVTKICDGWIAFYSTSHGMTVSIKPTRRAGYFQAKGALGTTGDESPGLNAALESLLSKPVGVVTVAQILGVA